MVESTDLKIEITKISINLAFDFEKHAMPSKNQNAKYVKQMKLH